MIAPDSTPEPGFDPERARISAAVYRRLGWVLLDLLLLPGRLLFAVCRSRSRREQALRMLQHAARRDVPVDRPGASETPGA